MILGNVRSLKRKMDELRINARVCHEYRESSMLVFTETWLHQSIPDVVCEREGFSLIARRGVKLRGKAEVGEFVFLLRTCGVDSTQSARLCAILMLNLCV